MGAVFSMLLGSFGDLGFYLQPEAQRRWASALYIHAEEAIRRQVSFQLGGSFTSPSSRRLTFKDEPNVDQKSTTPDEPPLVENASSPIKASVPAIGFSDLHIEQKTLHNTYNYRLLKGIKVLVLDNDGLSSISQLVILQELMGRLGYDMRSGKPPLVSGLFDVICGAGTGAILAIMLGRLEMSIVDVIQKFQELIDEVISQPLPSGEYDLDRFDAWSCDLISQCTSSKDTLMYDEGSTLTCKTFVCAATASDPFSPILFRSYMVRNNQSVNPSIREALQATFAKPGVLPLISFGSPPTNYMEWMYTNPSSLIDSECRQLSCRDDLTLVLNIGIDRDLITQSQEFPGEHSSHINEKLLQDSARIAEEARKTFGPKTFLRISVRTGAHDATGPVRSSAIVAHAFSYLSRDAKSELLDEIVTRLFPEENHKLEKDEWTPFSNWLSSIPFHKQHITNSKGILPGSGTWLLADPDFVEWKDSKVNSVLWLHGIPGSGKTKLTSIAINHLLEMRLSMNSPNKIAYFYCARNTAQPERVDPEEVLCSILAQIAWPNRDEQPSQALIKIYKERKRESQKDGSRVERLSVSDCVNLLDTISTEETVILIDGLDEFQENKRHGLLSGLDSIISSGKPIKLFISSRDEGDIVRQFQDYRNIYVSATKNGQDITNYVKVEVDKAIDEMRLIRGRVSSDLRSRIIESLTDKAQGMFLWVSLQLETLCDQGRVKLARDIENQLLHLPEEMTQLYGIIYERVRQMADESRSFAQEAIAWILYSQRPLTSSELLAAVSSRESWTSPRLSHQEFQDICNNLVVLDKESDLFTLVHLTAREYLEKHPDFEADRWHSSIANRCFQCSINQEGLLENTNRSILLQYASLYWPFHYSSIATETQKKEEENIQYFFSVQDEGRKYRRWAEQVKQFIDMGILDATPQVKDKLAACYKSCDTPVIMTCVFGFVEGRSWWNDDEKRKEIKGNPLFVAARWGHERSVQSLLDAGFDSNEATPDGEIPLIFASSLGHQSVARILLEKGASVDIQTSDGRTPLYAASRNGHEAVAQLLLERGASIDIQTNDGWTPLHTASKYDHDKVVRLLLERGAGVNIRASGEWTPLYIASWNGYEAVVQLLLEREADVDTSAEGIWTPLLAASRNGHEAVAILLLEKGANVNIQDSDGLTPLHIASQNGHEAVVRCLLERGASVDARAKDGRTPLYVASRNDHEAVARILLEKGANIDLCTDDGCTALYCASWGGHETVARLLLERGAGVDVRADDGATAIYVASWKGHEVVVRLLLEKGASIDVTTNSGWTPTLAASRNGHKAIAQIFLEKGANVDTRSNDGWTALYATSLNGHEEIAQLLLDRGASVNMQNDYGRTPLYAASQNGHEAIIRLLLERGASINASDINEWTPLLTASQNGHEAIAQILVETGANVDIRSNDGWTALYVASSNGHEAITRLMLEKGASVDASANDGGTSLLVASQKGHETVAQILLEAGANVDVRTNEGRTPLYAASLNGHEAIARILLEKGASVDICTDDGRTALYAASEKDHEAVARLLLEKADVNTQTSDGWTALYTASEKGHEAVARLLLEREANPNIQTKNGCTALYAVSMNNHEAIARNLLEKGASVDISAEDGCTALYAASWRGHETIVQLLLENRASVDLRTNDERTALYAASWKGHETVVRLLLEKGASVGASTNHGWTSLLAASQNGHEAVARILLETEVDLDIRTVDGWSALYVASLNGHEAIAQILLERGADINTQTTDECTALYAASEKGHEAVARLLLEREANPDIQTKSGCTALYAASLNNHEAVARILLEKGASVDISTNEGCTPLYGASWKGHETVVRLLLEKGASIDSSTHDGWTPLHAAVSRGNKQAAEVLLERGVNVNSKANDGSTPLLSAAGSKGGKALVEILLARDDVDRYAEDENGEGVLSYATSNGDEEIVELLLSIGIDADSKDKFGQSPLFWAIQNGNSPVVELLRSRSDVNGNPKDSRGCLPVPDLSKLFIDE